MVLLSTSQGVTVFAEEFQFQHWDDKEYTFSYNLINGNLTNLNLIQDQMTFTVNGTNGELILDIPKSIPFDITDYSFGHYNFILINNEELMPQTDFSDCFIKYTIPFDGETKIEILYSHVIAGVRLTYVDLPRYCLDDPRNDNKIQRQLNEKECSNTKYEKGFNIRDEVVCISPESYPWLNQRGYMKTFPIIKN